jgi:hypothetical protein
MFTAPMRSDQEHYIYTVKDRKNGNIRVTCINRTKAQFEKMVKNSDRGNFHHEILKDPEPVIIPRGKTCPNCKKEIKTVITITGKTGRPSKNKE